MPGKIYRILQVSFLTLNYKYKSTTNCAISWVMALPPQNIISKAAGAVPVIFDSDFPVPNNSALSWVGIL